MRAHAAAASSREIGLGSLASRAPVASALAVIGHLAIRNTP